VVTAIRKNMRKLASPFPLACLLATGPVTDSLRFVVVEQRDTEATGL